MLVRDATVADAVTIARNNVLLAKESENEMLNYPLVLNGVKAILNDASKGFYLVAVLDDQVIGQLMVTYEWSDWRNKTIWWVQSVYVDSAWRKKGTFTALFHEVNKRAKRARVGLLRLYVHDTNKKAMDVYRKSGMSQEEYLIFGKRME